MINELIKLADHLDKKGLHKEAEYIDAVLEKSAQASAREFSAGDVASIIHARPSHRQRNKLGNITEQNRNPCIFNLERRY